MLKIAAPLLSILVLLSSVDAAQFRPARQHDPYASLPVEIREVITRRGCRPPRGPNAESSTVVAGSFFTPRRGTEHDLAVLCMRQPRNEIVVIRKGHKETLTALEVMSSAQVGRDSADASCDPEIHLARGADLETEIRAGVPSIGPNWIDSTERATPVHDGILDATCDGVGTIRYWTGRRWTSIPSGD